MSTTAAPPPPPPAAPTPNLPRASPSTTRSPPTNGAPNTPRSANGGFGQNAVAGPSRQHPPPSPAAAQDAASSMQARLMLAQQTIQANMLQHQQQQDHQQTMGGQRDQQGGGQDVPERRASGGPDLSTMASAMGMLQGMQGSNKEQMMKQLQALTTSRVQRDRQLSQTSAQGNTPLQSHANLISSPANSLSQLQAPTPTQSGPIPPSPQVSLSQMPAPSPANSHSQLPPQSQPGPRPPLNLGAMPNAMNGMHMPTEDDIRKATAHLTSEQRDAFVAQGRARMAAMQQAALGQGQPRQNGMSQPQPSQVDTAGPMANGNGNGNTNGNGNPQAPNPSSGPTPAQSAAISQQRKQFIQSLLSYHKHANLTPPPEIFSGHVPGVLQMGSYTIELVELFMTIMRQANGTAGIMDNGKINQVFHNFVTNHHFPNPLPHPVKCPKPENSNQSIPDETDDTVKYLFMVYVTYLQGFEHHMVRQRSAMQSQRAAQAQMQQQQMQGMQGQQAGQGQGQQGPQGPGQGQMGPGQVQGGQGQQGQAAPQGQQQQFQQLQQQGQGQQQFNQQQQLGQQQQLQQSQALGPQNGQGQQLGQQQYQQQQGQGQQGGPGQLQLQQQQFQQHQQQQQQQYQPQMQPQQPPPPTQQIQPQPPPISQLQQQLHQQLQNQHQHQQSPTYTNQFPPSMSGGYQPPPPLPYQPPSTPATIPAPSPSFTSAPSPHTFLPSHVAASPSTHAPSPPSSGPGPAKRGPKPRKDGKAPPAPIRSEGLNNVAAPPVSSPLVSTPTSAVTKKRKKGKKELAAEKLAAEKEAGTPTTASFPPGTPAGPSEPVRPPTPKRARYKVEYKPLHHPVSNMCGWDERAVSSTFPKNNLSQPSRSIHDLGVVDMEAILMGLRSRLRREMGYGLTVLNMLSMPHPEDGVMGLPIIKLQEIFLELLDILEELALGDEGLEGWKSGKEKKGWEGDGERMDFLELEQLGRDLDWSVPNTPDAPLRRRDHTGGDTDLILSILNLLRNFSLWGDNQPIMASHPGLFHILAAISDLSLSRRPGSSGTEPYSILELGRVRRDATAILSNLGQYFDLRIVEPWSLLVFHHLISSYITPAWTALAALDNPYAPFVSPRDVPLPVIHSITRALDAVCKVTQPDSNREIITRHVPSSELVGMYASMIKLLPITRRQTETLILDESYLAMTECLALCLHSVAFLATQPTRAEMRRIPGALDIILRVIHLSSAGPPVPPAHGGFAPPIDPRSNPLSILCRRLAETLGVLNGTVSCGTDGVEGMMSFSAASASDTGWSFANRPVERGWLAGREESVWGTVVKNGVDGVVRAELDGMWWAAGEA